MINSTNPADLEAIADIKIRSAARRRSEFGTDDTQARAEAAELRERARILREGQ